MSIAVLLDTLSAHETLLWWLASLSVLVFVASLAALPFIAASIPEDYFVRHRRDRARWLGRSLLLHSLLMALKNLLGAVLVLAGLAMLVLPGQGLLTILAGVLLLNFPGKYRAERWLIRRQPVLGSINWLRRMRHRPPLQLPDPSHPYE